MPGELQASSLLSSHERCGSPRQLEAPIDPERGAQHVFILV